MGYTYTECIFRFIHLGNMKRKEVNNPVLIHTETRAVLHCDQNTPKAMKKAPPAMKKAPPVMKP